MSHKYDACHRNAEKIKIKLAEKFNQQFGETFIVPEPDIDKDSQLIPGIDGQKMSKSYNNTIPIFGDEKKIRKKFMSILNLQPQKS